MTWALLVTLKLAVGVVILAIGLGSTFRDLTCSRRTIVAAAVVSIPYLRWRRRTEAPGGAVASVA